MCALLQDILKDSTRRFPNNVAIKFENKRLTYRELDYYSDMLSYTLLKNGIKPNERVGIYIEKSEKSIEAIFGVLKSGACYVPLDPIGSIERQAFIINDCCIKHLITSSKKFLQIQKIIKDKSSIDVVYITDLDKCGQEFSNLKVVYKDEILKAEPRKTSFNLDGSNLAYILYTSGSTGVPKGVIITHFASLAFVNWAFNYFKIGSNEIVSSHAPYHFDLSIFDIFVTLKSGATICIVPEGMSVFPVSLSAFIEKEKINIWYSVPSVLIQLLLNGNLETRDLSSLKKVLFAGEVFQTKYLKKLIGLLPSTSFYNLYGPTETNVCTFYNLPGVDKIKDDIPIGKPCEGTAVYILDDNKNQVNSENVGELYVSGPTVMSGYWNSKELTEKVLFKDFPFSNQGYMVCRTGDLVLLNKDGNLQFHGRVDNMIKSRGYRIEPGEIESVLFSHPGISEVVVFGVPDEKIGKRIKAIVVLKKGGNLLENDIKLYCSKILPMYMVPEIIEFKETLPKLTTGKIDKKKLEIK